MRVTKKVFFEFIGNLNQETVQIVNDKYYVNSELVGSISKSITGQTLYDIVEKSSVINGIGIDYVPVFRGTVTELISLNQLLVLTRGNQTKAADLIGVNRGTFRKKMAVITEPCISVHRDIDGSIINLKLVNHPQGK